MYLFMTGYPGFIATRLLRELVERQQLDPIYLLVLKTPDGRFRKQAEAAVRKDLPNLPIRLVEGDISKPNLGIHDTDVLSQLKQGEGEWWHLAAVYRLDVGEKMAHQVNVEGTRNILALARECPGLKRHHYVSTAYVSGDREGKVLEDELLDADQQGFKNFYESTKHAAEVLVRESMPQIPTTIYRFGVVAGDSKTGETAKFDGPYFLMRFLQRWGKIPLPHVGPMTSRFNTVPVDFVVEGSATIAARSDTVGKTFHIVDPHPWTSGELYRGFAKALGCPRPRGSIPKGLMSLMARSPLVQKLLGFPLEAVVYMNHGADYDCRNTLSALKEAGVSCPNVGSYLQTLVKWYVTNSDRADLQLPIG